MSALFFCFEPVHSGLGTFLSNIRIEKIKAKFVSFEDRGKWQQDIDLIKPRHFKLWLF